MGGIIESISQIPFFQSLSYGILSMVVVGSSWCLVGLVMGDAPKRGIEPSLVQLFGAVFSVVLGIVILFTTVGFPRCSWKITAATCGTFFVAGLLNFSMLQIMAYAMQRGPNGIIWSIIQSSLVFPFIGGIVFFHMKLTWCGGIGIVLLLTALVLFGLGKDNSRKNQKQGSWRIPAFICLAIAAIQQNLSTAPSYFEEARAVSSIMRALATGCGSLFGAAAYNLIRMTPEHKRQIRENLRNMTLWKYVAALQFFGLIFAYTMLYPGMNIMADHGIGGACYPMMVGSCIVSFTLASVFLLKEKIRPLQIAALVICTAGLIFICIR